MGRERKKRIRWRRSSDRSCLFGFGITVLWLVLIGTGCGGGNPRRPVYTEYQSFTDEEQKIWAEAANARYHLKIGDTFAVDFKYENDLDRDDIVILPDGHFTMSGVDDVRAAGLTIPELDTILTNHFSQEYHNPDLSVIMQKLGPQPVYVLGEVNHPGSYNIPGTGVGILQAISLAGGFSDDATTSQVLQIRVENGGYVYKIYDMSHLEHYGLVGVDNLFVQSNDVIYVPRSTLGDLKYFSSAVLDPILRLSQIFWNVYALSRTQFNILR